MKRYIKSVVNSVPTDSLYCEDLDTYYDAALDPSTSARQLAEIAKIPWESLRSQIITHPNCTPELLGKLAGDSSYYIRGLVAENPKTPVSVLERLAKDRKSIVREHVADNPNIPTSILEKLSKDQDAVVNYKAKQALKAIKNSI